MDTLNEYRNADYDMDAYFDKTTSWPEGLQEMHQFEPNLQRPVRRSNSVDDIRRYKDHFLIARKNQGKWFKWKHYLKVLEDDLRHFDTLILMTKSLVNRLASPRDSEISHYVTASETNIVEKPYNKYKILKKKLVVQPDSAGDTDSVYSMGPISIDSASSVTAISINSNISLSPQKNLLKKFCSEVRQLASKTYRTVEKMKSKKSKYCSACGDYISNRKANKECCQSVLNLIDKEESIPLSMASNTNLSRKISVSLKSVASIGSGESTEKSSFTEQFFKSYKKRGLSRRMLPFIKENN